MDHGWLQIASGRQQTGDPQILSQIGQETFELLQLDIANGQSSEDVDFIDQGAVPLEFPDFGMLAILTVEVSRLLEQVDRLQAPSLHYQTVPAILQLLPGRRHPNLLRRRGWGCASLGRERSPTVWRRFEQQPCQLTPIGKRH